QVICQEACKHVLSIVLRGLAAEIYGTEFLPVTSGPTAMVPRADDEEVLICRIVPFEQFINLERPVEILLVPPARHIQRRHRYTVQPRREALPLPERIVVGMVHEVVPGGEPIVKVL